MKIFVAFILPVLVLFSCKKENSDFIWERSFSPGDTKFISATGDSGFIACGMMNGYPSLVRFSKTKTVVLDYSYEAEGQFTSAWADTSGFVAAGNTGGKLLLLRAGKNGNTIWDTTFTSDFNVDRTRLIYYDQGNFMVIGSPDPDATDQPSSGILFVRFDTTGQVFLKNEISGTDFISASDGISDPQGNIYLAVTLMPAGANTRAAVIKYNSDLQKIWETEIYNNPDISSACLGIVMNNQDSLLVTGKTEVARTDGILDNSYIVSLSKSGIIGKKKYLENSNRGVALIPWDDGRFLLLNSNCFIISIIDPGNGYTADNLRFFSVCNSYTTDAFGSSIAKYYDGNILAAGMRGGNFFLALKSSM